MLAEHLGRLKHARPEERRRPVLLFLRQELRPPRPQRAIVAYHQRRGARDPKRPRRLRQPGPVIVGDYARRVEAPFRPRESWRHVTVAIATAIVIAAAAGKTVATIGVSGGLGDGGEQLRHADGHPAAGQHTGAGRPHFVLDEEADRADF